MRETFPATSFTFHLNTRRVNSDLSYHAEQTSFIAMTSFNLTDTIILFIGLFLITGGTFYVFLSFVVVGVWSILSHI